MSVIDTTFADYRESVLANQKAIAGWTAAREALETAKNEVIRTRRRAVRCHEALIPAIVEGSGIPHTLAPTDLADL
jgi:hypothetical protein